MNGPLVTMFGDNFYHKDSKGSWIQEDSAHSLRDGGCNTEHLLKDTSGLNVLISTEFYYFGDAAPTIPSQLLGIVHTTQGEKKVTGTLAEEVILWITSNFGLGIHGDPLNWAKYDQLSLF